MPEELDTVLATEQELNTLATELQTRELAEESASASARDQVATTPLLPAGITTMMSHTEVAAAFGLTCLSDNTQWKFADVEMPYAAVLSIRVMASD